MKINTNDKFEIFRDYQMDTTAIGAAWDVDGDPCPAIQFEWAIERLDGKVIQDFISVAGINFSLV